MTRTSQCACRFVAAREGAKPATRCLNDQLAGTWVVHHLSGRCMIKMHSHYVTVLNVVRLMLAWCLQDRPAFWEHAHAQCSLPGHDDYRRCSCAKLPR